MQARNLLITMAVLQVLWLVAIWVTGAATSWWKLPLLLVYSVLCATVVSYLSPRFLSQTKWIKACLIENERLLLGTFCLGILVVGVPYAYAQLGWPDEPYVFAAARIIAEQELGPFFAGYKQIPWLGKQHPPLIPLLYSVALRLCGPHVLAIRLVALLFGLGALALTYRLGRELYDRSTGFLAVLLFLTAPFFFRIGATALLDMPVTFFFLLSLVLILRLLREPTYWLAVTTGGCIGAGLLCRYTMVLIYPVLFGACLLNGAWRQRIQYLAIVFFVSAVVVAPWVVYAVHSGIFTTQRDTIAVSASYVATARGKRWLLAVLLLRLPSGLGVANLPLLFLGGKHILQRRSRSDLFILLWVAAVFLPLMLTLPGPRYFFPAFPALAIIMTWGVQRGGETAERLVILALLYAAGALYLFVDWFRAAGGLFRH